MSDFMQGFIKGAKETPRGFFAPAIAFLRLLVDVTDSVIRKNQLHQKIS